MGLATAFGAAAGVAALAAGLRRLDARRRRSPEREILSEEAYERGGFER